MTSTFSTTSPVVRVGIDIAKLTHQILWELPGGKRRSLRVANTKTEIDRFVGMLGALGWPCEIAFEATGDYHRPRAYVLGRAGFRLCLVRSEQEGKPPQEGDDVVPSHRMDERGEHGVAEIIQDLRPLSPDRREEAVSGWS